MIEPKKSKTRSSNRGSKVNTTTIQLHYVEKDGFNVLCDAQGDILTDMALLKVIRAWRTEKSREQNIPPYIIMLNATLVELATRMPTMRDELLAIRGIGVKTADLYGDEILQIIKNHCAE